MCFYNMFTTSQLLISGFSHTDLFIQVSPSQLILSSATQVALLFPVDPMSPCPLPSLLSMALFSMVCHQSCCLTVSSRFLFPFVHAVTSFTICVNILVVFIVSFHLTEVRALEERAGGFV